MDTDQQSKTSSTLERALLLLEYISFTDGKIGVRELAESVNLPKSTTHRILDTLLQAGFVEQDPITEKYSIGLKAIEIGMSGLKKVDLVETSIPYLKELASITKQTTFLSVYNEGEIVYMYKAEGTSSVITNATLGTRSPVHCTGLGKAILAYMSLEEVDKIITEKGLRKYTETTITDRQQFLQELSKIRQVGIAYNYEEHDEGLSSIAAPIFNFTGHVVASISVAGLSNRISEDSKNISMLLKEKSSIISKRLGFVPAMRSNFL